MTDLDDFDWQNWGAEKVLATDLQPGDTILGTPTHDPAPLTSVAVSGPWVHATRADGWTHVLADTDLINITRKA